jgi:hypothetical protein
MTVGRRGAAKRLGAIALAAGALPHTARAEPVEFDFRMRRRRFERPDVKSQAERPARITLGPENDRTGESDR